MIRRAFLILVGTVGLAACTTEPPPASVLPPGAGAIARAPSTAIPAGHGVAILAPLSGPNAARGQALVQAAQLALAAPGSPPLDVRDTGGTQAGAAAAAQAAIQAGAGIIIGPLTAAETDGAAGPATAAGVPVLAFTSDATKARPGVWTLGITPVQQVRRLVGAAITQGKTRFAAVVPQTDFGNAMADALVRTTAAAALPPPQVVRYSPGNAAAAQAVREVSAYDQRRGPIDAKIKEARASHDAEGRRQAADLAKTPIPPPPFDDLLLADTGERLAWLSSFLAYYDVAPPDIRVLGPALWSDPTARAGAELGNAWYAAPDPNARVTYAEQFQAKYNAPAPGLADLAYDAAAIARVLGQEGNGYAAASLCRPEGFAGVDGLFALQPDGGVRRGLALFELRTGGPQMIEPAPDSLAAPGI